MAKNNKLVFLRDLTIDGIACKVGEPLEKLKSPSWMTSAWIAEAQHCGHIGPEIEAQESSETDAGGAGSADFASAGEAPQPAPANSKKKGK